MYGGFALLDHSLLVFDNLQSCRYGIGKVVRGETKLGVNITEITCVAEKANCR